MSSSPLPQKIEFTNYVKKLVPAFPKISKSESLKNEILKN